MVKKVAVYATVTMEYDKIMQKSKVLGQTSNNGSSNH